ncbi:pyridoxal phosphate-dependent aminotransferase [Thioflexithrix psekupsensis]|uniref:Aminotransferase n=1 Tax=Thioflexithrix psekupsensis TaxID=1570016 RepID=A0A251X7V8_9GAMM|nr:pyridoxal phosphate-dependent aminotransferase [Thioflexithrix psekupsensis]OUD13817.1 hypothetical protein TPSD3_05565 [Thioflexithrix psekupsensis]
MGKGVSAFNVFDHVDIQLTPKELSAHTSYGDVNGLQRLRQAIARYYGEKFNYDLNPNRICITDGASGALTIAFALLTSNGGEIILPDSCYPVYRIYANLFAARYQLAHLHPESFHIDIPALKRQISKNTHALLINSPSNPHGAVLSEQELAEICELGVPIIFDEVYQALSLSDKKIPSAIHYSDQHFIVNSFSKSLSIAGFRLGYLIVPERYIEKMTNAKATMNICTSLPSQLVGEMLLKNWDFLIQKHCEMLRKNWQELNRLLPEYHLSLYSIPEAGFFAVFDVSALDKSSLTISLELIRQFALNSAPGIDFQTPDPRFIRLNFACPIEDIAPALNRFSTYLQQNS